MELKIESLPVSALKPYAKNAKIHTPEQIEQIKESIRAFGMNDPVGIWGKDNEIVEGHGRVQACQELGIKTVPVIRLDHLTDEQRRAYALVHNKLTMNTGFDMDLLEKEIASLNLDLETFGFAEISEDEMEFEDSEVDFTEPEITGEPEAKLGDLYRLGDHILMVGDATDGGAVATLMGG